MANEIVIDITADFKDNASRKIDNLNQELKELEEHKNIDLNISFENSRALSSLDNIEKSCNRMESRIKKLANLQLGVNFNVDITGAERNVNRIVQKLSGITNRTVKVLVTPQGLEKTTPSSMQTLVGGSKITSAAFAARPMANTQSAYSTVQRQTNKTAIASSDKSDPKRTAVNSMTKEVLSGIGGIIGSAIGPEGTVIGGLLGKAVGSLAGNLLGDKPAELLFGTPESPEESFQRYIDKGFSSLTLPQSMLSNVASSILASGGGQINPNERSINQGKAMQNNMNSSYSEITDQGDKVGLKQNNGVEVSDSEYASYLNQAQGYAAGAIDLVTQQWYTSRNVAKNQLEENDPYIVQLDEKYKNALNGNSVTGEKGLIGLQKELGNYIQSALSDNNFTSDEMVAVSGYMEKIQGIVEKYTPDQTKSDKDSFDFLLKSGNLSYDSFLGVFSELHSQSDSQIKSYADERQQMIDSAGGDKRITGIADATFFQKSGDSLADNLNAGIGAFKKYKEIDLEGMEETLTSKKQGYIDSFMRPNYNTGKEDFNSGRTEAWQKADVKGTKDRAKTLSNELGFSTLSKENPELVQMASDVFSKISPDVKQLEKSVQNTINTGGDPTKQIDGLVQGYKFGAMAGDESSVYKYTGALMADNKEAAQFIESALKSSGEDYFNPDFLTGYYLKSGHSTTTLESNNLEPGETVQNSGEGSSAESSQDSAGTNENPSNMMNSNQFSGSTTGTITRSDMPGDELASGTLEMLKESLSAGNIDFKSLGLGESLMGALGEGLSSSEIDFGKLDLGKDLMSKIGESLTSSEIDFTQLDFGKNLMSAIAEGLTESEIDFKDLGLGESLISQIGKGLTSTEIDFSELGFGENLMSAIVKGLTDTEIDFEGLGLGESLISQIGEGLTSTEIDFSELGFGENLMAAIVEGLTDTEIDFEGLGLGESLMGQLGEGLTNTEIDFSELGFGENLMTALVAGLTESDIDFEGLGLGESLMSLIGEGLTDTEIDFSEMGFGENLMSALVAGLTESEIDFEGLGIGETIMSMLSESLSAIDFSESGIGESMMASIANAFSSVSFEEMDLGGLGEGLSAAIASSLTELDLSSITEQFSLLSETPIQLEVVDNASPIIQGIQEPIQGLTEVDPNVNVAATDNASATISGIAGALANLKDKTVTVSVVTVGGPVPCAEGTMDAPGGLVMINDENTSDPRELIEHNGTYMMYEGRNVLTTLAPHDKVYTASQTKAIMEGMGIPRYERGKNNNIISSGGGIIPTSGSGSSGSGVAVGGVNLSINVSGGDADVIDQIKKRGEEVAEYIAGTISSRLSDAYANTPVTTE